MRAPRLALPREELAWLSRKARQSGKTLSQELADVVRAAMVMESESPDDAALEAWERGLAVLRQAAGLH